MNQLQNETYVGRQAYYAKHRKNHKKTNKNKQDVHINRPQPQQIHKEITPKSIEPKPQIIPNEINDEPIIDFYEKPQDTKIKKCRDAVLGSLMAMATIAMPVAILMEEEPVSHYSYVKPQQEQVEDIVCNVDLLAKGGKDDYTIESDEIMQIVNVDGVKNLPPSEQRAIMSIASVYAQSVNVHDPDAKSKVIKEVQYIQNLVDNAVNNSLNGYGSKYSRDYKEYEEKYISGNELVNSLNYSEILKYQKDVSVLRALLSGGMSRIRRDDPQVGEKFDDERDKAQKTIDQITYRYKMNSRIVGNDNFDNSVTAKEMEGVIDMSSLKDLSPEEQKSILSAAFDSYKTITFQDLKNDRDIERTNERVGAELQNIQNFVDSEARKSLLKKYNISE